MRSAVAVLVLCAGCDYILRVDHVDEATAADAADAAAVPFAFVQSNWFTDVSSAGAGVDFGRDQIAGNLNVVVVGWTSAPAVTVSDDNNNTYQLAQAAMTQNGIGQAIYYAENIAAGANKVTVAFVGQNAMYPDIRILEYAGPLREGSFLGGNTAFGTAISMSSEPLAVLAPHALLVAGFTVAARTDGVGAGYTERISTDFGNFVEDQVVMGPGMYTATAVQSGAASYVVQLVAFALL